jgi:phage gp36-like protein
VYATRQDLIDRFGEEEIRQLTDRALPAAGVINDTVVNRALADADGDINAAVRRRYTLPLATIPSELVRVACNLARYYLYDDRAGEEVTRRFQDEKKFLAAIADGSMTLGVDAAGDGAQAETGSAEFNESRRVFGGDACGRREFG